MADLKPPRLVAGERETVQALIQYQRDSFLRKVTGVSEDAARSSVVGSGTTLLWLIKHMARAESLWIIHRFAGQKCELPPESVDPEDTVESATITYKEIWRQVDAVVAAAPSLDEVCRNVGPESLVNLRWVLMHLLEEMARHAGHADILRELIDDVTGR
jgi:uncharacterized damage-inducible protein DinB